MLREGDFLKELSENYQNFIYLVRAGLTGEKTDLSEEKINFSSVYELSVAHCITALVFAGIKNCSLALPREIEKKFSSAEKVSAISSGARNDDAKKILSQLEKNNIDCMLLKGILFQEMYPQKHMRYSADIDFLIKNEDYKKCCSIIKNMGYFHDSKNDKHDVFTKKPFVCIEVHSRLSSGEDFFNNAWVNAEKIEKNIFRLKKEYELAYFIYHMKEDLTRSAGIGVHSLCDLWLYLKNYEKELDKEVLKSYLTELGIYKFFLSVTELCKIWFDNAETDEFYNELSEIIISGNRGGNMINAASLKIDGGKPLLLGKAGFLAKKIFLPYRDLKRIYPALGKFPPALPFFWGMRITGIIFRPEHRGFSRASQMLRYTDKERINRIKGIFKELEID